MEALIDQVISEIGSDLQDRSIAMGWGVIANFLPDEVIRQAAALGHEENLVQDWYLHAYPDDELGQRITRT